jgi:hypothetical protein
MVCHRGVSSVEVDTSIARRALAAGISDTPIDGRWPSHALDATRGLAGAIHHQFEQQAGTPEYHQLHVRRLSLGGLLDL